MKISIICPTHRQSLSTYSIICELLSLDPNKFEVIIRNKSTCENKSRFLESLNVKYHKILNVDNNGSTENFSASSKIATGEFLFFVGDDDWVFKSGLELLHQLSVASIENKTLTALIGTYLVSSSRGIGSSKVRSFSNVHLIRCASGEGWFLDSLIRSAYGSAIRIF